MHRIEQCRIGNVSHLHIAVSHFFEIISPYPEMSISSKHGFAVIFISETLNTNSLPVVDYGSIQVLRKVATVNSMLQKFVKTESTYNLVKMTPRAASHKPLAVLVPGAGGEAIFILIDTFVFD